MSDLDPESVVWALPLQKLVPYSAVTDRFSAALDILLIGPRTSFKPRDVLRSRDGLSSSADFTTFGPISVLGSGLSLTRGWGWRHTHDVREGCRVVIFI